MKLSAAAQVGLVCLLATAAVASTAFADSLFLEAYYIPPSAESPESVDIGDLNDDGRNDVAMVNFGYGSSNVDIFFQNPDYTLAAPVSYSTLWGGRCVEIADINNDGLNDLVIGSYQFNPIYLLYQTSPGSFDGLHPVEIGPGVKPHLVTSGDFNSDGLTDVAALDWGLGSTPNVYVLYQQTDGSLGDPVTFYTGQQGWNKLFATDLNNDELDDLVVMNGQYYDAPNITILYQDPDTHSFEPPVFIDLGSVNASSAAAGDINDDGLNDLVFVAGSYPSQMHIYYQRPDHSLPSEADVVFEVDMTLEAMEIADVDLDGLNDIIAGQSGGSVYVFLQNSDNTIEQTADVYGTFYQTHIQTHGMMVGDINFDGSNDVVLANYNYGLVVLQNASFPDCNENETPDIRDIATGFSLDVNGNGVPDECDCPGDLNSDFQIGLADLAQLLAHYGITSGAVYLDGDLDFDGDVDLADLAELLSVYGTACE